MLELFRNNVKRFHWVLWLIIFSFVLFFGVSWWQPGGHGSEPWVATVNGEDVSYRQWAWRAQNAEEMARQRFGEMYEQVKNQLNVRSSVAEQLIQRQLMIQDARRLGLSVSDEELGAVITNDPSLQENGRFVGKEAYANYIRRTHFGSVEDFEEWQRGEILRFKWQELLATGAVVTDEEVEEEFRKRYERVSLEYVALPYEEIDEDDIAPSTAELEAWYSAHRDDYVVDEARRAVYVLVDQDAVENIEITDEQVAAYYEENKAAFTQPEQRRARHILLRVASSAPEDVVQQAEAKAQDLVAQIRGGADFEALAREHSADPGSASKGGDLGWFPRGRMVPQFDEAVFSMEPGQVSDPVRTNFGFHVIRLEEIKPTAPQPLEEVTEQIRSQLRFPKLREAQKELAQAIAEEATDPQSLRAAAESRNLEVRETEMISPAGTIEELGPAPEVIETIFSAEQGTVSAPVSLPSGEVVLAVEEIAEDYLPPLDQQKDAVLREYKAEKVREEAAGRLEQALMNSGEDLTATADRVGVEFRTTDPDLIRGQQLEGVGIDPAVERAAFTAREGEVVGPVEGRTAAVVLRVLERQEPDMSRLAEEAPMIRRSLQAPLAEQIIVDRLESLREKAEIERNLPLLTPQVQGQSQES